MPNLQRPQRHNPLRPYIDQSNTESSDSFSQPFQSTTDGTSTPLSSDSEGGMRAGPPRRGMSEKQDHQIYMGGTGVQGFKEPKEIVRKRVAIMTICGLVIAAIITVAVLGVKKLL